jgi:hypothetical protein
MEQGAFGLLWCVPVFCRRVFCLFFHICHFPSLFLLGSLSGVFVMADLHQIASPTEPFPVFTGKKLHKKAFPKKGKVFPDHAALVAGVLRADLSQSQLEHTIDRINKVKRVFKSRVEHYAKNLCLEKARKIGMKLSSDGGPVQTYNDILLELESNSKMESFQNWYKIFYEDYETKNGGKKDAERRIMEDLKIKYLDDTVSGGCVGDLLNEVIAKLVETMQKRSKEKQGIHLTKSRPEDKETGRTRRKDGDYFIIRSDSKKKMTDWYFFNVSVVGSTQSARSFWKSGTTNAITFSCCRRRIRLRKVTCWKIGSSTIGFVWGPKSLPLLRVD